MQMNRRPVGSPYDCNDRYVERLSKKSIAEVEKFGGLPTGMWLSICEGTEAVVERVQADDAGLAISVAPAWLPPFDDV